MTSSATTTLSATRRRKARAVLAAGLVLGVGAAVTLANWSDDIFAGATFGTGTFDVEGSTSGADSGYQQHSTAGSAATLDFELTPAGIAPGQKHYAPFWVRLDADSTLTGTLTATGLTLASGTGDVNANAAHLGYDIYTIDADATCDASVTGTPVASGATLSSAPSGARAVALAPGTEDEPGEVVQLCFVVAAGPDLLQGDVTTATWQFTATSE